MYDFSNIKLPSPTGAPEDIFGDSSAEVTPEVTPERGAPQMEAPQTEESYKAPQASSSLGGLYFHDPNAVDDPQQVGKYITKATFFGGDQDVSSGQDNGRYALGGGSWNKKFGNSRVPVVALPHEWYDNQVVQPGQMINVYNPQDPSRSMPFVVGEKGPGGGPMSKGVGADLYIPEDLKDHLGIASGDNVGLDFTKVFNGTAQQVDQAPEPGTEHDYTLGQNIRAMIASQPGSSMIAGNITADSIQQAMKSGPKGINPNGSIDFGNGISYFKGSRIIEADAGGTRYQWRPGEDKPHIVNVNPKSNIIKDPNTGGMFDISDVNHPKAINLPGDPSATDLSTVKAGDWDSVPEEFRDVARMIAQYKYPPVSGFALRSPYFQQMFKIIGKVDPSFDQKNYATKQKVLTDYAGEGKNGQNILSINTAIDHLGDAAGRSRDLANALGNPSTSGAAYVKTKGAKMFGYSEPGNYEAKVSALINELERATSGGAPHEGGKANWANILGPDTTTHGQRLGAMDSMVGLLGKRLHEIQNQYERTFGQSNVSFLSPDAETVLQGIAKTGGKDAQEVLAKFGSDGGKKPYIDPNSLGGQLPSAQGQAIRSVPTTINGVTFEVDKPYYDNSSRQTKVYKGLNPDGTPHFE